MYVHFFNFLPEIFILTSCMENIDTTLPFTQTYWFSVTSTSISNSLISLLFTSPLTVSSSNLNFLGELCILVWLDANTSSSFSPCLLRFTAQFFSDIPRKSSLASFIFECNLGSKDTNHTVLEPSDSCPSKYLTLGFFLLVLIGDRSPTNTPSTFVEVDGTRSDIFTLSIT